jgi:23S rRNA (uracil1939-C5)-methyltransferase
VNAKVEDFANTFASEWGKAEVIVIDPPRDGMHPSAYDNILSFWANEMVYVSCNPATLARDLEVFIGKNRHEKNVGLPRYRITDITPVDMFPHTHHIETIVHLERL